MLVTHHSKVSNTNHSGMAAPRYSAIPLDFAAYLLNSAEETPIIVALHSYTVTGEAGLICEAYRMFVEYSNLPDLGLTTLAERYEDKGGDISACVCPATDCIDEIVHAFLQYRNAAKNSEEDVKQDAGSDVLFYLSLLFYLHTNKPNLVDLPFNVRTNSEDAVAKTMQDTSFEEAIDEPSESESAAEDISSDNK